MKFIANTLPQKKKERSQKRKEKRFNLLREKEKKNFCSFSRSLSEREGEMFTFHIIHQKIFNIKEKRNSPHLGKHKKREKVPTFFSCSLQSIFFLHFCHFTRSNNIITFFYDKTFHFLASCIHHRHTLEFVATVVADTMEATRSLERKFSYVHN